MGAAASGMKSLLAVLSVLVAVTAPALAIKEEHGFETDARRRFPEETGPPDMKKLKRRHARVWNDYEGLISAAVEQGNRDQHYTASALFARCLEVEPDALLCQSNLAVSYMRQKRHLREAEDMLQACHDADPENRHALANLEQVREIIVADDRMRARAREYGVDPEGLSLKELLEKLAEVARDSDINPYHRQRLPRIRRDELFTRAEFLPYVTGHRPFVLVESGITASDETTSVPRLLDNHLRDGQADRYAVYAGSANRPSAKKVWKGLFQPPSTLYATNLMQDGRVSIRTWSEAAANTTADRMLQGSMDHYAKGRDGPAYVLTRPMAKEWRGIMKDANLSNALPDSLYHSDQFWTGGSLSRLNAEQYLDIARWRLMTFAMPGSAMFFHKDGIHLGSWQAQIKGTKRWFICEAAEEQLLYNVGKCDAFYPDYEQCPLMKLARCYDEIIRPGDVLYYPMGAWHQTYNDAPPERLPAILREHAANASPKGAWGSGRWNHLLSKAPPLPVPVVQGSLRYLEELARLETAGTLPSGRGLPSAQHLQRLIAETKVQLAEAKEVATNNETPGLEHAPPELTRADGLQALSVAVSGSYLGAHNFRRVRYTMRNECIPEMQQNELLQTPSRTLCREFDEMFDWWEAGFLGRLTADSTEATVARFA